MQQQTQIPGVTDSTKLPDLTPDQIEAHPLKQLLTFFKQTLLSSVQPRPTTGTVHLWRDHDIIGVQIDERLPRVFNKMIVEGVLSTPVLDVHRRYVDTVELLDVVVFVSKLFQGLKPSWTDEELTAFFDKETQFVDATVETVLREKKRRGAFPVSAGTTLLQGLCVFQLPEVHRIPVISAERRVVGFLSQSMAISLLSQNTAMLGPFNELPVSEVTNGLSQEVLSVPETAKAIDVFRFLSERNISGVAIVDAAGNLTDTISVRDLRGIGNNAARWKRLALPVKAFKEIVRSEYAAQTPPSVLSVTLKDNLGKVIELFDDGNLHRVFVVEDGKPKFVISQGDLLAFLAKRCGLPAPAGSPSGVRVSPVPSASPTPPKSPFAGAPSSGTGSGEQAQGSGKASMPMPQGPQSEAQGQGQVPQQGAGKAGPPGSPGASASEARIGSA